jgi:TRAP-type mannitol/chloroaromatic compound transport system permease small subunit
MSPASATRAAQPTPPASALAVRTFGWAILAGMAAFLVVNALVLGGVVEGLLASLAAGQPGGAAVLYALALGGAVFVVRATAGRTLREDAAAVHRFNLFLVRACFWAVFLIGVADAAIAFMRIEKLLPALVGPDVAAGLGLSRYVGTYVHGPLLVAGVVLALVTRTLGVHWLALLTVAAELLIVISRFVFSYEQAFMGDLVRYWYAALFLFASAYTLYDDGHVRVDVLYAGFSPRTRGIVNAAGAVVLGIGTCALILALGLNGKSGIINTSVLNFEVSQVGQMGMFIKFHMGVFLGIFAVTMIIQFVSAFFESVADARDEPGRRVVAAVQH